MLFWKGLEFFSGKIFRYLLEFVKFLLKFIEFLLKFVVFLLRFVVNKFKDLWFMLLEILFKKNIKDFLYKIVDYCIDWVFF